MMTKKYLKYLLIMTLALLILIASSCTTPADGVKDRKTEDEAQELAEDFLISSPTFAFDGIENTLQLAEPLYPDIENAWQYVFHFESYQAGYGDRTGQMLAQVITSHEAVITVEQGKVKTAVMDGKWDMVNQKMLND